MHRHSHNDLGASIGLALLLSCGWCSAATPLPPTVAVPEQSTRQTRPARSPNLRNARLQPDVSHDSEKQLAEDAQDNWITAPQQPVQQDDPPASALRF